MTELNRGGPDIYDQVTRIGGMIGVCLLIIAIPRFANSRSSLVLFPGIDRIFTVIGLVLLTHYITSSAYHFAVHYPFGKPYFDGHRVLPVFLSFSRLLRRISILRLYSLPLVLYWVFQRQSRKYFLCLRLPLSPLFPLCWSLTI